VFELRTLTRGVSRRIDFADPSGEANKTSDASTKIFYDTSCSFRLFMSEELKKTGKRIGAGIEFHPPDCFIIADFYKNGINKIYSGNNHFLDACRLDACRLFGMDTSKMPTQEREIEKQMKEIFKQRRKGK
jgi:hypothetical protein